MSLKHFKVSMSNRELCPRSTIDVQGLLEGCCELPSYLEFYILSLTSIESL